MNIKTPEQFLHCLDDSGVLSKPDLQVARETAVGLDDPKAVARRLAKQGLLSRWQASQILAGKLPAHLGKYKLLDQLGVSESGAAFLAEHEQMERRVVVKTIARAGVQTDEALREFLDEARRLAAIDHRNIIHVFDVDSAHGQYYLVLEYVQGESLQRFVDRDGPLAYEASAGYIALAASALAEAHQRGIQHHRLQPDRLLVDQQGELKILDMGVARLADPQEDQRRAADVETGDVDYVAPEQATGKHKVDQRADVYALGCCLYFVLTGQVPFPDGNRSERLKARLRRTVPDVRELRPETPARLAEICARMMATQPRERLTAEQAGRQLNEWLKEHQAARLAATAAAAPAVSDAPQPVIAGDDVGSNGDDVDLASFAIRAETSDRRTPVDETVGADDEPEELLELLDEGNKKIWIIAGSVGGAAAVVLLGVAVFLLTRPADGPADAEPAVAEKTLQESDDKQAGPDAGRPAAKNGDQPTTESDDEDDDFDFPEPGAFSAVEPADGKPAEVADAQKTADPKPPVAPAKPAPADAQPDTKPDTKPDEKPDSKPDKPPAKEATPKKPAPAPAPPATLLELTADNVSLPAVDSVEPLELGKAVIKERSDLTIYIEGGDSGHGGKGAFSVAAAAGSDDALAWEIRHGPADGEQTPVARLAIADQKLKFNWLPAAAEKSDAPFLQNCLLNLAAGETTKALRLRDPQRIEPLQIAVTKSGLKPAPFRHEVAFLPDPASVFIELQVDEGTFGPSKFVPQEGRTDNLLPADRGKLMILLGDGEALGLKMEGSTSRDKILIKATTVLRGLQEGQEDKFEYDKLRKALAKQGKLTERMNMAFEKMNKVRDDKQPSKKDQKTLAEIERSFQRMFRTTEENVIKLELDKINENVEHSNKALIYVEGLIGQLQDVISSGGKIFSLPIELRVYRTIGAAQLDLLKTSGWEAAGS